MDFDYVTHAQNWYGSMILWSLLCHEGIRRPCRTLSYIAMGKAETCAVQNAIVKL
jgi:hypothetical protein